MIGFIFVEKLKEMNNTIVPHTTHAQHMLTAHYTHTYVGTHSIPHQRNEWKQQRRAERRSDKRTKEREHDAWVWACECVPKCPYKEYEMSTWEKRIHEQNWNNIKSQLLDSVFLSNLRHCASMCLSVCRQSAFSWAAHSGEGNNIITPPQRTATHGSL